MNIINRFKSDDGAVGTTETVLLIALAVALVLVLKNTVVKAISEKSKNVANQISGI